MGMPRDIDARKFARVAKQRLDEAILIHQKLQLSAAAAYLAGYAIECSLKALLLTVTPPNERPRSSTDSVQWLKKEFGHDLDTIRRRLAQYGARMPTNVTREFLYVSTWDPQARYEPGPGDPVQTERFLSAATSVFTWALERM